MDVIIKPFKTVIVPELVKGTGQNGSAREWHYQDWFVNFFQEHRENWKYEISKFNVTVSRYAFDNDTGVTCLKLEFHDMKQYTEFCLRWM